MVFVMLIQVSCNLMTKLWRHSLMLKENPTLPSELHPPLNVKRQFICLEV
jgi:hypothetical protein